VGEPHHSFVSVVPSAMVKKSPKSSPKKEPVRAEPEYEFDMLSEASREDLPVWSQYTYGTRGKTFWASLEPKFSLQEFQAKVDSILKEYFASNEASEAAISLAELDSARMMDEFVARAVRAALEARGTTDAKNMTSVLFTLMHARQLLDSSQLARGFEKLAVSWDDLALDLPGVHVDIMLFVNRAITDGCLDETYVSRLPEPFLRALADTFAGAGVDEAVEELRRILPEIQSYKQAAERVAQDAVAGASDSEVQAAVEDLGSGHLRHEVVRKLVIASLSRGERERKMIARTLSSLRSNGTLSEENVSVGLTRVVASLDDLVLDYPEAGQHVRKFWAWAVLEELVPPSAVQAVGRLRIGGKAGTEVARDVVAWTTDPLVTASSLFTDEVDAMDIQAFRNALVVAVQEFFDSVDGQEFARILRSLNIEETSRRVEVVRKVISGALDRQAKDCHAAVSLLNFLVNNEDLKQTDINVALRQLHDRLPDLTLDVPDAAPILETFASKLQVVLVS
jgi:hypothetical protein